VTPDTSRCENCGAVTSHPRPRFCSYCGAALAPLAEPAVVAAPPSTTERLAAVEAHPDFPELLRHEPSVSGLVLGQGLQVGFGILFIVVSLVITLVFLVVGGPCAIFPLLFVVVGIGIVIQGGKRSAAIANAKLLRFPAVVLDERTKVVGSGDAGTRTRYFATLEWQGDGRREFEVDGSLAGAVVPGDAGVAYVKERHLLDFRRLDV
jgi:hypothetical protein